MSHLLSQWRSLGAQPIGIVVGGADGLNDELTRLDVPIENRIENPAPDRGMFSSIQCGARWTARHPQVRHWIFTLGDQPHLLDSTLESLLTFGSAHPDRVCQPFRSGRPKHPVWLPHRIAGELARADMASLKEFLRTHADLLAGFECDDPGLEFDLDTPADYERLKPGC